MYWTVKGALSGIDRTELTEQQLDEWGCKYHELVMNEKSHYEILICNKTKRIEEL